MPLEDGEAGGSDPIPVDSELALLREAARLSAVGWWRYDTRTDRLVWSDVTHAIFGTKGRRITVEESLRRFRPESRTRLERALRLCLDHGTGYDMRVELDIPGRGRFWCRAIGTAERDANGRICAVGGSFQDVSREIAAEQQRRQAEARLGAVLDSIADGFFLLDADWRFVFVNEKAGELLQRSPSDLIRRDVWAAFPEAVDSPFESHYREAVRTGRATSFVNFFAPLDTWFEVSANPTPEGLAVYFRDVSEQRIEHEMLRLLEASVEGQKSGVVISCIERPGDLDSRRIIYCNRAVETLFGHTRAALEGQSCTVFHGPRTDQTKVAEARRRAMEGRGSRHDLWVRTASGEDRLCDFSLTPLRDPAGTIRHWLCIYDDITVRREMEERARSQERLSLLGQMAGGVSHDFNNLLSVILGNIELLEDEPDPGMARTLRSEVVDAVMRGRALNESLLTFAGRAPLQPDAADLVEFVESVRPLIERVVPSAVKVDYDLRRPCPNILIDPAMAESCLLNLVINARQAVAASGRITISVAEADSADLPKPAPPAASRYVALRVADTGAGMSEEVQQRAFEPFFTTRATGQGSGLGLSRVRGYVEQMGGCVHITSAEGQGTEIALFFPVLETEPAATDAPLRHPPTTTVPLAGTRVLLVEDNAMLARVTARHLASFGCSVVTASNGDDALERFSAASPFDALVTDVVMPGLPGDKLARQLVETAPRLVAIVITGYRDRVPAREDAHPRIRLLEKPFTRDILQLTLRELLEEHA